MVPAWLSWLTELWSKWGIRIAASSSLVLYIILLLVADIRRYNFWPGWTLLLWVAYQGLDIAGSYALGNLSLDSGGSDEAVTGSEQLLVAFWAPFLLLHLGGPDNIGAYSLDDDKLGWRKAFGGIFKILGALFVVLTKIWLADDGGLLRPASIIMVVVGALRFAETVRAVVQALVRKKPPTNILFDSSKQKDSAESGKRDGFLTKEWKEFLEVVEEEARKIYDVLYTKGGQVHTWRGYLLRLLSPLATTVAFALFVLYPKDRVQQVDVNITYFLLSTALLLDVVWLVAALASTSAKKFVEDRPGFWFRDEILCSRGWWHHLNRITQLLHPWCLVGIDPSRYRSCSGSIGRYDLVQECTRASPGYMARRLWTSILGQDAAVVWWSDYRSWKCLSPLQEEVKNLLFERVHERLRDTISRTADAYAMTDIRERWGQEAVQRRKQRFHWANNLVKFFGREFQEDILLWHIGTTIYLCSNNHKQCIIMDADHDAETTKLLVKAIEAVSEYLMFLVAARPHMLPDPPLRNLYEVTEKALQDLYNNEKMKKKKKKKKKEEEANDDLCCESARKKKLAKALRDKRDKLELSDSTRLVSYAAELAIQLQEVDASRLQDVVELVFDVWVDKLLYAGIRCSRESHARQLGRGGEFITIAWIAAEYAGVFIIGETGNVTTPTTTSGGGDTPPCPDPSNNADGEAGCWYPEEKETCHCHEDPLEPVCTDTCCMEDYYCCAQDDYYSC